MFANLNPERIERLIAEQVCLAEIAGCDEVRAMHLELAALHRAQLACFLAAEKLGSAVSLKREIDLAA